MWKCAPREIKWFAQEETERLSRSQTRGQSVDPWPSLRCCGFTTAMLSSHHPRNDVPCGSSKSEHESWRNLFIVQTWWSYSSHYSPISYRSSYKTLDLAFEAHPNTKREKSLGNRHAGHFWQMNDISPHRCAGISSYWSVRANGEHLLPALSPVMTHW